MLDRGSSRNITVSDESETHIGDLISLDDFCARVYFTAFVYAGGAES
ncbi:hypothetical protein [Alloactinosynnema sp. L-07]|nr:hypothetical protein [Alloactinosynnema sp. L-07]